MCWSTRKNSLPLPLPKKTSWCVAKTEVRPPPWKRYAPAPADIWDYGRCTPPPCIGCILECLVSLCASVCRSRVSLTLSALKSVKFVPLLVPA